MPGKEVLVLMQINGRVGGAKQEGYKLLKKIARRSTCRPTNWELIDLGDALRIYLEYKAQKSERRRRLPEPHGKLDFDVTPSPATSRISGRAA